MIKPITPKQAEKRKKETFPEKVIEVFNELITEHFDGYSATIRQEEAAKLVAAKLEVTVEEVYKKHWLDVEDVFREAGWDVDYDKPGYNETYEATFKFSKKGR